MSQHTDAFSNNCLPQPYLTPTCPTDHGNPVPQTENQNQSGTTYILPNGEHQQSTNIPPQTNSEQTQFVHHNKIPLGNTTTILFPRIQQTNHHSTQLGNYINTSPFLHSTSNSLQSHQQYPLNQYNTSQLSRRNSLIKPCLHDNCTDHCSHILCPTNGVADYKVKYQGNSNQTRTVLSCVAFGCSMQKAEIVYNSHYNNQNSNNLVRTYSQFSSTSSSSSSSSSSSNEEHLNKKSKTSTPDGQGLFNPASMLNTTPQIECEIVHLGPSRLSPTQHLTRLSDDHTDNALTHVGNESDINTNFGGFLQHNSNSLDAPDLDTMQIPMLLPQMHVKSAGFLGFDDDDENIFQMSISGANKITTATTTNFGSNDIANNTRIYQGYQGYDTMTDEGDHHFAQLSPGQLSLEALNGTTQQTEAPPQATAEAPQAQQQSTAKPTSQQSTAARRLTRSWALPDQEHVQLPNGGRVSQTTKKLKMKKLLVHRQPVKPQKKNLAIMVGSQNNK